VPDNGQVQVNAVRALRIGIDATDVGIQGGTRGGIDQYVRQLIRHVNSVSPESELRLLFALPHRRHTGTIREFMSGFGGRNVAGRRGLVPARHMRRWRIPVEWFLGRVDVFHAPAHLGLPCREIPMVVTVHDLAYLRDHGGARAPTGLTRQEHRQWESRHAFFDEIAAQIVESAHAARLVITVSGATRDDLVATSGIDPAKVRVVHLGLRDDVGRVAADVSAAQAARYGLRAPYWLYVGVLDPNKNLVNMLEGFALYRRGGGKRLLAIAGKPGYYHTVLGRHAGKLGLADAVQFLGYVPDAHLSALYSGASAVVMPSPLEGFGLPAIEAMACGTPVIAANAGALPEVVGDAGILVDANSPRQFAEAMLRLEGDGALRADVSAAGARRVPRFSWQHTAHATLAVYAEAAGVRTWN
jgi:glycosyltransferase involved in cell wall biosynthesis